MSFKQAILLIIAFLVAITCFTFCDAEAYEPTLKTKNHYGSEFKHDAQRHKMFKFKKCSDPLTNRIKNDIWGYVPAVLDGKVAIAKAYIAPYWDFCTDANYGDASNLVNWSVHVSQIVVAKWYKNNKWYTGKRIGIQVFDYFGNTHYTETHESFTSIFHDDVPIRSLIMFMSPFDAWEFARSSLRSLNFKKNCACGDSNQDYDCINFMKHYCLQNYECNNFIKQYCLKKCKENCK